jgi:hypothetical protein
MLVSCTANIASRPNMQILPTRDDPDFSLVNQFIRELSQVTQMAEVQGSAGAQVEYRIGGKRFHLDFKVRMALPIGGHVDLAIEAFKDGYPRDVRLAVERLLGFKAAHAGSNVPIELCVIAGYLSSGSRKDLEKAGINYFDGTGSMRFAHRSTLIVKDLGPRVRATPRPMKLFAGAREQVIHALLEHWRATGGGKFVSGTDIALRAQTSNYTVSQTMQELEREDWVESSGSGPAQRRRLTNPGALLDAWAAEWISRREKVTRWYGYSPNSNLTDRVLWHFTNSPEPGWALTGAAAANAVLAHLTNVDRVQVIVPPGRADALGRELKLKQVDKGANFVFVERVGASLMFLDEYPERLNSRFSSRFIQYLDLLDGYGRNKDLAREYRRKVLRIEEEEAEDEE